MIAQVRTDMGALRGQLFSLVEATGISDRQQRAFKSCIRVQTYDAQARLEATLRGSD